jgi:hypothetical protein
LKYLIPSLGRAEKIGNILDLLVKANTYVFVHEREVDEYAKYMDKKMIRPVPDSLRGIVFVRKFMYESTKDEDYTFQLDDDFSGMIYRHESDDFVTIKDKDHIHEVIQNAYQVAYDLKTPLFYFSGQINPTSYTLLTHVKFSATPVNQMGIIPELMGSINYDTRFRVMEDQDISLQAKYHKRYVFEDDRYNLRFHTPYFQESGCSTNKNTNVLQECGELLLKKWGRSCIKYDSKKIQVKINFPF